jgi:hypothetical protein
MTCDLMSSLRIIGSQLIFHQPSSSGKIRKDVFTGKIIAYVSPIVKLQNKIAK